MINLRRQLEFRYYSPDDHCSGNYQFIGKSFIIEPLNSNEPTHIHLAYGNDIDQMYVSYLTNSSEYIPQYEYGLNPLLLNYRQNGTTTTYSASDMCEGKANTTGPQTFIDPEYMHTILLKNLEPSTRYYYRVRTNEHGWPQIYSFVNRPLNKEESMYIIAYENGFLIDFIF